MIVAYPGLVHPRLRIVLFGCSIASLALVGLAAVLIAGADGPVASESEPAARSGSPFEGALMPRDVPAPDFSLTDQDGKRITMREYRGRPVVVTFLYSTCEDTCPLEAQQIRAALDELAEDDLEVPALAVSVDPTQDTEGSARRFTFEQRMPGRLRWVLGSRAELEPVWRGFFVQEQSEESEHQARVVLVDAAGRQRVGYPGQELTPDMIEHDVRVLLNDSR